MDTPNEAQAKFILGPALSELVETSASPIKSRWTGISRHNSRSSPTKSPFSQIRNRSYMLAVSPQRQAPATRSKRSKETGTVSKAFNFSNTSRQSFGEDSGGNENEPNVSASWSATRRVRHHSRSPIRRRNRTVK